MSDRLRIEAGITGKTGKVEVKVGDDWHEISRVVSHVEVDIGVDRITTATIKTIASQVVISEAILSDETLQALAEIADAARARNRIAPPVTQMVTVPIHVDRAMVADVVADSVGRSIASRLLRRPS